MARDQVNEKFHERWTTIAKLIVDANEALMFASGLDWRELDAMRVEQTRSLETAKLHALEQLHRTLDEFKAARCR